MRKKKRISFFGFCRVIFITALFFAVVFIVIRLVVSSRWDGNRRFSVVIDGDPLVIFSIEPSTKQAFFVSVPTDTILNVPYGYSTYPAGAVYQLGRLDSQRGGLKLLAKSI